MNNKKLLTKQGLFKVHNWQDIFHIPNDGILMTLFQCEGGKSDRKVIPSSLPNGALNEKIPRKIMCRKQTQTALVFIGALAVLLFLNLVVAPPIDAAKGARPKPSQKPPEKPRPPEEPRKNGRDLPKGEQEKEDFFGKPRDYKAATKAILRLETEAD